jgi:hypothetical protein
VDEVPITRADPPRIALNPAMPEACVDHHRVTLDQRCDGVAAPRLRERAVPPSKPWLLGLDRHMAEVERN